MHLAHVEVFQTIAVSRAVCRPGSLICQRLLTFCSETSPLFTLEVHAYHYLGGRLQTCSSLFPPSCMQEVQTNPPLLRCFEVNSSITKTLKLPPPPLLFVYPEMSTAVGVSMLGVLFKQYRAS